jgi:hypothetical protein
VGGFYENGGQAVATLREVDYVGRTVAHEEVRAITVEQAMEGIGSEVLPRLVQASEQLQPQTG